MEEAKIRIRLEGLEQAKRERDRAAGGGGAKKKAGAKKKRTARQKAETKARRGRMKIRKERAKARAASHSSMAGRVTGFAGDVGSGNLGGAAASAGTSALQGIGNSVGLGKLARGGAVLGGAKVAANLVRDFQPLIAEGVRAALPEFLEEYGLGALSNASNALNYLRRETSGFIGGVSGTYQTSKANALLGGESLATDHRAGIARRAKVRGSEESRYEEREREVFGNTERALELEAQAGAVVDVVLEELRAMLGVPNLEAFMKALGSYGW